MGGTRIETVLLLQSKGMEIRTVDVPHKARNRVRDEDCGPKNQPGMRIGWSGHGIGTYPILSGVRKRSSVE